MQTASVVSSLETWDSIRRPRRPCGPPAILNPFIEGTPDAVMTRIALDWIIEGTPLDQLFQEVAAGQYEREFALGHFVQVMLDVACGFRPTPAPPSCDGSSSGSSPSRPSTASSDAWSWASPRTSSAARPGGRESCS